MLYAILTWFWFQLNNSNDLPIIGHTDLVNGWINEYASKTKLLFDLIYFAISVAVISVATDLILSQISIPFLKFKIGHGITSTTFVYFVILLYEFHVLEFRIRLLGLLLAVIVFLVIDMMIYVKILEILIPILKITNIAETISDAVDIHDRNNDK